MNMHKTAHIGEYLLANRIDVFPYEQIFEDISPDGLFGQTKIVVDDNFLNTKSYRTMNQDNVIFAPDIMGNIKMVKNSTMIGHWRQCQIKDGAALVKFFAWLRHELLVKGSKITEYEGTLKLTEFRAMGEHYMGDSFGTILSTGANGAIVHYKPDPEHSEILNPDEMILCDSGGHYKDGTTDTTRTLHFKQPSDE